MRLAVIRLTAAPLVGLSAEGLFGGAEVRAFLFAQGLAERTDRQVELVVDAGQQVTTALGRLTIRSLATPSGRSPCRKRPHFWRRTNQRLRRLRSSLERRLTGQPPLWPELATLEAEVLCSFGLHDPTASIVRTARQSGKRSVVCLTSDDETQRALQTDAVCDRHRRWHRYALDQADLIVAQTRFQQLCVADYGRPVELVRNPIDTQLPPGERIRPIDARTHVLWVGRADTNCKRADLCLQLAARCPAVPFVAVMNPHDPRTFAQLQAACPANARIVPRIDWQLGDYLYRDARALLNTSESEGFPNAFLQAAKYGVPILSRRVNPDQALTDHRIGLVAEDDLERLAGWLGQLFAAPEQFTPLARAARRYVEAHHALEARVAEFDGALRRVADWPLT
jgi:glycosyltransferase involved in cell wall biosynthesis